MNCEANIITKQFGNLVFTNKNRLRKICKNPSSGQGFSPGAEACHSAVKFINLVPVFL